MRKLLKSFKTEIHPTPEQKCKINKTIGTCRYIYNFYLSQNKELHEKGESFLSGKSFRTISGNPRQFNYRDESAGVCMSAQCKQYNNPHPLLKYKYKYKYKK